jgi:hypothetical protein
MAPTTHPHPGYPVLAIRTRTSERQGADFVHDALEEIRTFMHDHDLQPSGPPFTIVTPTARPGTLDIEAGWPIDHPVAGAGRIHGATLPPALSGHSRPVRPFPNEDRDPTDLL